MRIGILGAGPVGTNLGKGWLAAGHEVMWSSREPASARMLQLAAEAGGSAGTVTETADFGEVAVVALRWEAIPDVIAASRPILRGKVLIDTSNRFDGHSERSPSIDLRDLSDARVAKCFNTIGAEHFLDPVFAGRAVSMFLCGDDEEARQVTAMLAADLGFEPVDLGGLDKAPILDHLAALWVGLAVGRQDRGFAVTLAAK